MSLTFEWDEEKARENLEKHKTELGVARTLFNPAFHHDSRSGSSVAVRRFLDIGRAEGGEILVVAYTKKTCAILRTKVDAAVPVCGLAVVFHSRSPAVAERSIVAH